MDILIRKLHRLVWRYNHSSVFRPNMYETDNMVVILFDLGLTT